MNRPSLCIIQRRKWYCAHNKEFENEFFFVMVFAGFARQKHMPSLRFAQAEKSSQLVVM
jgi:hypothetical protein